MKLVKLVR